MLLLQKTSSTTLCFLCSSGAISATGGEHSSAERYALKGGYLCMVVGSLEKARVIFAYVRVCVYIHTHIYYGE